VGYADDGSCDPYRDYEFPQDKTRSPQEVGRSLMACTVVVSFFQIYVIGLTDLALD
jgi:hypothetical protein